LNDTDIMRDNHTDYLFVGRIAYRQYRQATEIKGGQELLVGLCPLRQLEAPGFVHLQ